MRVVNFLLVGEQFTVSCGFPSANNIIGVFNLIFFKKIVCLAVCALFAVCFSISASAQVRDRVVRTTSSRPTNLPPVAAAQQQTSKSIFVSRPVLTDDIQVVKKEGPAYEMPLVRKTGSSLATNAPAAGARRTAYGSAASILLDRAIK